MVQGTIEFDLGGECLVRIVETASGFSLSWTDYIANEWVEDFSKLSLALARVAVLAECYEHNWEVGFVYHEEDFGRLAQNFLRISTTPQEVAQ